MSTSLTVLKGGKRKGKQVSDEPCVCTDEDFSVPRLFAALDSMWLN